MCAQDRNSDSDNSQVLRQQLLRHHEDLQKAHAEIQRLRGAKAPHSYKDGERVEIGCEEAQEIIDHLQATVASMPRSLGALKVEQAVREGKDCSNGHESSPMALCLDGGHQGPEQYYWFCPLCLAGERLDTKNMSVDANNEHPMRKGTGL